uniref:Inositol hexakisphosphate and diphosphoinositol-pentakisphosphate kinase n=1 Tax=Spongospora subterranea TaxID=70186 RepID=A0A0H5QZV5_9EUKA|eukprot:CRZ01109.1 hypothetical protein [Spongospora subterranea]
MVIIGVCAMAKKVLSQPMTEILDRIRAFGDCQVIIFQELMILNSDIEDWPKVEVLIAFHSTGFPLNKAIMYSELEPKPFLVNDLILQRTLLDRRLVYKILEKNCISTPHYLVMNRDADGNSTQSFEEYEGHICIDGQLMKKPFVEKPVSGDDHNIRVYYPDGGGCRRLFRKIKDRSSEISHENCVVRRNGSYVYEEFVETGRDIKVFAVGSSYAHSESRKSPTVDGIVERNRFGKERRQIERLTDEELSMATMVTKCFKQTVCGLDILRNDNKSYVIDVNGWSFVKGDARYYDHCANILRNICRNYHQNEAKPISDARQLVGILGVFRHSDRTPKQKIKILSTDPEIKSLVSIGKLKTEADRHLLLTHVQSICFRSGDGTTSHDNLKYLDSLRSLECVLLSSFKSTQLHVKQDPKGSAAALVVCKWGGEITESGIQQSLNLGLHIRQSVADEVGSDLSNFISNTAAHSSHMDRVRMSAEKFLEAFSASSPSTFYKVDEVDPLVRFSSAAKEAIQRSKNTLEKTLLEYRQDDAYDGATPIYSFGISTALKVIDSPQERLAYLLASLKLLIQYCVLHYSGCILKISSFMSDISPMINTLLQSRFPTMVNPFRFYSVDGRSFIKVFAATWLVLGTLRRYQIYLIRQHMIYCITSTFYLSSTNIFLLFFKCQRCYLILLCLKNTVFQLMKSVESRSCWVNPLLNELLTSAFRFSTV